MIRVLHMKDAARELGCSLRALQLNIRKIPPVGRWAGRKRLFTESDFRDLKRYLKALPPRRAKSTDLYVIRCGEFVKIGVSNGVSRRLASIKMHCPYPLEVLHTFKGRARDERDLHGRFQKHRQHGEWFRIEGDVKAWLDGGCLD